MSSRIQDRARWRKIIQSWLKTKPSGYIFRSREIYSWIESGAVQFKPQDLKPYVNGSTRPLWRYILSCALGEMYRAGELRHPGIASQVWMVP